jgi:UDP-N-acetylglucosamine diphosphorylase / glucose-1-phosphate thymidylyltransferase / UDP-N-acetylgalactosamine diphosphorylase / glucosamine-1-phosphate N-acetyltransferase / galactosamine-1-phosphate N-acetyltransferase
MRKYILRDHRHLHPFNEEARDLRIQNKPLWLHQRDTLAAYTTQEVEYDSFEALPADGAECLVHCDNLYFDQEYIDAFMTAAQKLGRPSRAAFAADNRTFTQHVLPLSTSFTRDGNLHLANLWYFPTGVIPDPRPVVIDFQSREIGYYHIPTYMATDRGDLVYQVPLLGLIAIDSWVHILLADMLFGLFKRGARFEKRANESTPYKLSVLWRALLEQKQVLRCSEVVRIGRNCTIDPSAVITGPASIGDNCTIGAGVVIDNCTIGDNVNITQGSNLLLSTVGDGAFLPFRASLFMTTLMENAMVAQNTCLQLCVVGRRTFIGAGSTWTDYNLLPAPIRAMNADLELRESNSPVLGGCVGHNCRIGSGMIIYPSRTIESDVVLFASPERRVIDHNISFEESDHHKIRLAYLHKRLYPRKGEKVAESW